MRRHWFFDIDGTLCDTEADIKRAWRAALRELGRDCPQFDAVYRTGPTLDQVTYMLFDDATPELVEQIRARFKICYDQGGFPETKPYPWVPRGSRRSRRRAATSTSRRTSATVRWAR